MKTIAALDETNFDQIIGRATLPAPVDFFALWGGFGPGLTPMLDPLAEHFAGRIQFASDNIECALALGDRFHITGVPTLPGFQMGTVREETIGFPAPKAWAAKLHAGAKNHEAEVGV